MIVRSSFLFKWYLLRRLPFHGVLPNALPCHTDANYITKPYLPVMFSMLAFSIMAPKSTLECGGAGSRDTDMGLEAMVIFIYFFELALVVCYNLSGI